MATGEANVLVFAYTAVKALLEVFLIGLTGYIFAKNGTLTKPTLKSLSIMSINLLTPALLFSKMTETLDPGLLIELWNEPFFYFIYGGFSLLWSRFWTRTLKIEEDYGRLCDVATFFSNTNTLPVSLIKSIALSAGSQFLLKDANDTPLKVAARGVSYAMIFATLNNILRWSFGVALMGGVKTAAKRVANFNSVSTTPRTIAHSRTASDIRDLPPSPQPDMLRSYVGNDGTGSDDTDELTPLYLGASAHPASSSSSRLVVGRAVRLVRSAGKRVSKAWGSAQKCMTPPVYAIIAAFVVILIDPLHEAFMDEKSMLYTVWSAIDMCGDACVPLILISLGGQLGMMSAQQAAQSKKPATDGNGREERESDQLDSITRISSAALVDSVLASVTSEDGHSSEGRMRVPPIMLRTDTEAGGSTIDLGRRADTVVVDEAMSGDNGNDDDDYNDGSRRISAQEQHWGVVVVLVGRFVFVPTLATALITTLRVMFPRLLPIMVNDPVYILTLLILSSTPPAINLITVAQATGKFESEAAQILFYGYVIGIFVLAVEVSGFLWLTNALTEV
ncbi:hypothetical protein GGI11_002802 [Coemansia sp. RSA 2049]|nr:hypothetical protein GGI11_002802 [Coemansia sp. RSA 2049]